jgi:predicted Zn-dependent peptidase
MKGRALVRLLLVALLLAGLLPNRARADEPFFDPARFKLDNGLEVWVQPRPGTPAVALRLMVRVGSRYETADNNGISHFVEHVVFTGSEKWDEAEIKAVIDRLGGEWNGSTGYEGTWYQVDVRRDYMAQAMEWLAQVVTHPTLAANQVDDERQVIIQEQGGEMGLVFHLLERLGFGYDLDRAVRTAIFPDSALALDVIGSEASLRAVDHASLLEYYHTYYVPDNMVLVVVGDIAPEEVRDLAQIHLGNLSPSPTPITRPPTPAAFSGPVSLRLRGPYLNDWAQFSVGYRTAGDNHPDRHALEVAAEVLSFRLDESVRYERGLVYSIGAFNATFTDTGYFQVWTASEGKNLIEIQPLVEAELERLRAEPASPDDLTRAQRSLNGRHALWLETNGAQADNLASMATWLPPGQPVPDDFAAIDAVTAADVQRVAQTYFVPHNRYTARYRPAATLTGVAIWVGIGLTLVIFLFILRRWRRQSRCINT